MGLKIVELDPKTWARGKRLKDDGRLSRNMLLGPDGMMCCMGFAALACGATPDEIRYHLVWNRLRNKELAVRDYSDQHNRKRLQDLYTINDDEELDSDAQRVDSLNAALAEIGEDFRFKLKE